MPFGLHLIPVDVMLVGVDYYLAGLFISLLAVPYLPWHPSSRSKESFSLVIIFTSAFFHVTFRLLYIPRHVLYPVIYAISPHTPYLMLLHFNPIGLFCSLLDILGDEDFKRVLVRL